MKPKSPQKRRNLAGNARPRELMEMKNIEAKQCTTIALGRLGENNYTVVRFDVSAWLGEVPGAVIGLYNQRPGDNAAYPVAGITVDGGIATWTITSAELTQTGEGKCELVAIAGEVVAKSAIFLTMVFDALDGSGEAPEPWEEWQQQFIILKNETEQAAERAEEAVEHYPRINNGVWEVWDVQAGVYVSTGVQAQGPQGIPGEQGEPGEPGPQGETGPQGEPGADGTTFTPSVSAEGVLSWTNDGGLPNPQSINIKGPPGSSFAVHICSAQEYDATTRVPTIVIPDTSTFYLVPAADGSTGNMYLEWIYANGAWEKIGNVSVDLSNYQLKITATGLLKGDGQGGVTAALPVMDYGTYSKPSGGIPASDLAAGVIPEVPAASDTSPQPLGTAAAGSSEAYSRADHVHAKPTAEDIGAVASNQGQANAGKFMVVGSDGTVSPVAMAVWQGGSY
jgi:hypothetical protein